VILVPTIEASLPLVDRIAAEHVELAIDDAEGFLARMRNAGAVFLAAIRPKSSATMSAAPTMCCRRRARHASRRACRCSISSSALDLKLGPEQLRALAPAAIALPRGRPRRRMAAPSPSG